MARLKQAFIEDVEKEEVETTQLKVVEENYVDKLIKKRKTTTQKVTFDLQIDLIKKLKRYQLKYPQGFKKEFIDSAVRAELNRLDRMEDSKKKTKESSTG